MATPQNPFGPMGAMPAAMGGANPFNPMGGPAAGPAPGSMAPNPYGAPAPAYGQPNAQQYQAPAAAPVAPPAATPWGAPTMQQQQQPPAPAPAAPVQSPWGAQQTAAPNQMVVSQTQSNPYAGIVAPATPQPDYAARSVAPAAQQPAPWGAPAYGAPAPAPGGFDPFAAPPAPPVQASAPPPAPVPPQTQAAADAWGAPQVAAAPPMSQPAQTQHAASQQQQLHQYNGGAPGQESRAVVPSPAASPDARNKYARELAHRAPPGSSPLPKAELVKKSGYVLGRISFRTIVMKKWKQAFWVQYGNHTMLWFRSQGDFDDWLNNPYHNQAQRNFLIKLAVNFVHDLYKPNVRGYQVTQCRSKPYGTKMVRQFKLERWMDYGPTIAAAFGSYDPKEVDALREAIVECMRNTPLDGGIKATGAVAERPGNESQGRPPRPGTGPSSQVGNGMNQRFNSSSGASAYTQPNMGSYSERAARSVVSANDLLDDHRAFDDTVSLPPGRAIVPAASPAQSYPGAPPPQPDLFGAPPTPQQQYPVAQAPPTPQQQYPVPPQPAYQQPPAYPPQQQQQPPQNAYYQAPPPQQYQQQQPYGFQQQQSYPVQGLQF